MRDSEANLGIWNSINFGFFFLKNFPNIWDANKNGNLPLGLCVLSWFENDFDLTFWMWLGWFEKTKNYLQLFVMLMEMGMQKRSSFASFEFVGRIYYDYDLLILQFWP